MRIAADTNVLVRYLTGDDEAQAATATQVLEGADAVILPTVVLCETVSVLRRAYGFGAAEVAETLRRLLDSDGVETDRPAAEAGVRMLERGGDFADGVIAAVAARSGCDALVTFDRRFADIGRGTVTLLSPDVPSGR